MTLASPQLQEGRSSRLKTSEVVGIFDCRANLESDSREADPVRRSKDVAL